jgi:hypothetical protein
VPNSTPSKLNVGGFELPAGLNCVRCDHPLTYIDHSLRCRACDTVLEVVEREPPPDACPNCDGPLAWMGGALVCSPVRRPSRCSRGFVAAAPAPQRSCARCNRPVPSSIRASLCAPCALRAYADLRPAAARVEAANADDTAWREAIGFGPSNLLWGTTGQVSRHPGYRSEVYAVEAGSATLRPGQLACALPPWSTTGGPLGTVWLVRLFCPSGMVYEVALPAGRVGDEAAAVDEMGRRVSPLPERMLESRGVAPGRIARELRTAREIINTMSRNPGGRPPDPVDDIVTAIRQVRANGDPPSRRRVAMLLYSQALDPSDSLKQRLKRLRDERGITWDALLQQASDA